MNPTTKDFLNLTFKVFRNLPLPFSKYVTLNIANSDELFTINITVRSSKFVVFSPLNSSMEFFCLQRSTRHLSE